MFSSFNRKPNVRYGLDDWLSRNRLRARVKISLLNFREAKKSLRFNAIPLVRGQFVAGRRPQFCRFHSENH